MQLWNIIWAHWTLKNYFKHRMMKYFDIITRINLKERYSRVSKCESGFVQNVGDKKIRKTKYLTSRSLNSSEEDKLNGYDNVEISCQPCEREHRSTTGSLPICPVSCLQRKISRNSS